MNNVELHIMNINKITNVLNNVLMNIIGLKKKVMFVVIHVITIMILQSKETNVYQTVQKLMIIMFIMNNKDMNVFRIVKTVNIHI